MAQSPIIVGLDQSSAASAVLAQALMLRGVLKRPLVVVTAVDMPADLPAEFVSPYDAALETEWRAKIAESMQTALRASPKDAIAEHIISISRPSYLLCEIARDYRSPLIVIGSHGHRTADTFLGTTAARVVNNAETSVFVCRPWREVRPSFRRVLVGLDGSPRAQTVLASAVKVVAPIDAKMILVRAVVPPVVVPTELLRRPHVDLEVMLTDHATRYLTALKREACEEVVCETAVRTGAPWNVICDQAEDTNADVVVIGAHGYDLMERVLGTTAARVVNHSARSVLVVRGEGL